MASKSKKSGVKPRASKRASGTQAKAGATGPKRSKNDESKVGETSKANKANKNSKTSKAALRGAEGGEDEASLTQAEASLERFLPEAKGIAKRDIVPFRADIVLALSNLGDGVASVLAEGAKATQLPGVTLVGVEELLVLGSALGLATRRVDRNASRKSRTPAQMSEAAKLRSILLTAAQSLKLVGELDADEVNRIAAGRGFIDMAQDLVDLAALFRANPAARKKSVVTRQHIDRADALGAELLAVLRPTNAKDKKPEAKKLNEAVADRDALWTLLTQRHETLRRVGFWIWGEREIDAHVPALQARKKKPGKKAAKKAEKTPTTVPPSA